MGSPLLSREVLSVPLDGVGEPRQDLVVVFCLWAVVREFLQDFACAVERLVHFEFRLRLCEHREAYYQAGSEHPCSVKVEEKMG